LEPRQANSVRGKSLEVFQTFLKIGLTAFGGPIAHLGYFEREIIERRKWLTQNAYGDLVALCQFLPGPASSQAAFALGYLRAGIGGAFAATAGFTVTSAVLMIAIAYGFQAINTQSGFLHGLKLAAVAVVAQAVWTMAVKLCPIPGALAPVGRRFLPLRGTSFWRRSRSLASVTIPNGISRLVGPEHFHGRLRSRTSNAGTIVHFCSLPWDSNWAQLVRRIVVPCMDLSSLFPVASRRAAVLE
jgi:chromate transport protein ChrA